MKYNQVISGKCPVCNYNKLIQRWGDDGVYQLDACANCGFGFGDNGTDTSISIGPLSWLPFAIHLLSVEAAVANQSKYSSDNEFTDIKKAYIHARCIFENMSELKLRKEIFNWTESQSRVNVILETVFTYDKKDIKGYLNTNPVIFKTMN